MNEPLLQRYLDARDDPTLATLEGFHALKHALRFGAEILHTVTDEPRTLRRLARELAPDILDRMDDISTITTERFRTLAPRPPATRVLAIAARPRYRLADALARPSAPIVFLDRPRHLGNLGAAIRVAAAAGAGAVLASGEHDPWHPAALRGSAGLHFALPVLHLESPPETPRPIIALHPDGDRLRHGLLPRDAILAFGSERHGLSDDIIRRAHRIVAIPMRRGVSSLNLATAVAVTLYSAPDPVNPAAPPSGDLPQPPRGMDHPDS